MSYSGYERMPENEVGFILIGPSGVGKSTLRNLICEAGLAELGFVKYLPLTTRAKRQAEDEEYRFVSKEQMQDISTHDNVIFGNTSYGNEFLTLWPEKLSPGQHYVYIYLPEAAIRMKKAFPNTKIIQIIPHDISILSERILSRDPTIHPNEFRDRVMAAEHEIEKGREIADTTVVNDGSVEKIAASLSKIMLSMQ